MKVLQICSKPPFPPDDGGRIAMKSVAEGLIKEGIDLKILCISTYKHPYHAEAFPVELQSKTKPEQTFIDTHIRVGSAFVYLLRGKPYNVFRFYNQDMSALIKSVLKKSSFDIIHLESLFVAPYLELIRKYSKAKVILRSHNIEGKLLHDRAGCEPNFLKGIYMKILAKQVERYEILVSGKVDGIAAISPTDCRVLQQVNPAIPVRNVPTGLTSGFYNHLRTSFHGKQEMSIFHIGSMDWAPNLNGLQWFIRNVWPLLHKSFPKLRFHIAGRNPGTKFSFTGTNIIDHGEVSNAYEFMLKHYILVVPLFESSGIRIKILEAMALGKTVVSTSQGAKGIKATDREHLIIADNADDFNAAIGELLLNKPMQNQLSSNAIRLIEEHYDLKATTKELLSFYNQICG